MPAAKETKEIGIAIAKRVHLFAKEIKLKTGDSVEVFCDKIKIPNSTFSTILYGTKLLNAVNIYYLMKEYPKIDLYWLITGEKGAVAPPVPPLTQQEAATPVTLEQRLAQAQQEIEFLRSQNATLNQVILNLSTKV